uniref:Tudor domain-containing protein 1 n=1 Tax=Melanaphis sacchari TaxID=742174 RepID=A0A2H8TG30_9HEMI
MPEQLEYFLPSGSTVYMTGVVDLKEIYVRKLEDHDDDHEKFLDMVNEFCSSALPINRPLIIGEIVGAQSIIDDNFYRGKVLKKIDDVTYSLQFIDFGDKDSVPLSKIFEIPKHFMTPSNVFKITLKGVNDVPLNVDALNYISNLLSTYEPMIIEFSSAQPLTDVSLRLVNGNENVNERLNELLGKNDRTSMADVTNQLKLDNVHIDENTSSNINVPVLKKGDSVYITTFINVYNCYVRKVEDDTDEFTNFIETVNLYCSAETPIGKLPKLNDLIGAKSIDGSFYRAKVIKKINDNSYDVKFIDYGIEENVSLSDIVNLSTELKQLIPTTILVKLKDVPFIKLNEAAHKYISFISENDALIIDMIDNNTNEVILKTENNENVNSRLKELMFEDNKEININDLIENEEEFKSDKSLLERVVPVLQPGSIVYLTAFISMDEMYIRKLDDYDDEFHNLLEKVNEFCLSAKPIDRPLVIGQIVGAQSTLDDSFYRGKVLKKMDDVTYSIQFIDFGDKDNVPMSKIFEIPTDFMVSSTIVRINLKGIKSHSLSIEASNYITNLLSTYEPLLIDFDNTIPIKDVTLVILKNNENVVESFNKLLKDDDNAKPISIVEDELIKEEIELPDLPSAFDVIVKDSKFNDVTNILKNEDIVYITAYIDVHNIYVRKFEDNTELQNLVESVNTCCASGKAYINKSPELNEIVGAKSSVDGSFYRAKIIHTINEKMYGVIFIDFGFEESVNVANIVPLPIHLQQVTSTLTQVGLKGACFEELNSRGHDYLESLMLLSELMKIEFEDLSKVELTVISQNLNVIDHLNQLHEDEDYITMDNTIINNSLKLNSGMKYISNDISVPLIPPLTNKSIVTIHAFISLKDIYITLPFDKTEVDKFLKDFSVYCLTSQPITKNPVVGEVFGIRSSTDNSFNRGAVEEKLNENQYKVVLFDLGTKDIVSANSFVEIPEHLKQVPRTIYSIRLKGIDSGILNAQAMSYVNMLCENLPLIIEFDEKSPNGLNAVTLTTIKTQQNVNNHLIKLLAQKERDSPETVQMLSKGDIVYISTFVDLHAIYVRRINNGTDKFKSFLENFSSSCALENPIENDPKVGEIIAAREQNGTKFYRAEVISRVDNNNFYVCFIDFGSWDTIHKSNIVQPSESQLQNCPPTFMVSLHGLDAEHANTTILHYLKNISQTDTFIIDSITEQNQVVLISVNTQRNINKEVKKLLDNRHIEQHIQNDVYAKSDINIDTEKCVIKYHKLPLDVPTQVWVAEKISSSRYSVHTYESRLEFIQLENQIFEDSKSFESVKSISVHMPCIVYFSPSWYRGEVLEVIDKTTAKVGLVDVGNFSVVRSVKEIFHMPSKYKGKSLLVNIEIQPEPQEKLSITTFRIVAKRHLDNVTEVEVLLGSTVDQSYDDLVRSVHVIDNVGLPSFSSTPIPEDSGQFQFDNSRNEPNLLCTTLCRETTDATEHSERFSNMLTIKDVQYAKWLKGAVKTLTFLCVNGDCLMMRDHLIDDTLTDLESKIQEYCVTAIDPLYTPAENELCLAKYVDELWYRAICVKTPNDVDKNDNNYMIYFLDWGLEYLTNVKDICKIPKDFIYLPAAAHKCYVKDAPLSKWSANTMHVVSSELGLQQLLCTIDDKLSNDSYIISCASIKDIFDTNPQ